MSVGTAVAGLSGRGHGAQCPAARHDGKSRPATADDPARRCERSAIHIHRQPDGSRNGDAVADRNTNGVTGIHADRDRHGHCSHCVADAATADDDTQQHGYAHTQRDTDTDGAPVRHAIPDEHGNPCAPLRDCSVSYGPQCNGHVVSDADTRTVGVTVTNAHAGPHTHAESDPDPHRHADP